MRRLKGFGPTDHLPRPTRATVNPAPVKMDRLFAGMY